MSKYRHQAILLGLTLVIVNIGFHYVSDSLVLGIILLYWVLIITVYRISDRYLFYLALLFLFLTPWPLLIDRWLISEKFAVWQYLFAALAIFSWIKDEIVAKLNPKK